MTDTDEKQLLYQKHRNFHLVYVTSIAASPTGLLGLLLKYPDLEEIVSSTGQIPWSWIFVLIGYACIVGALHLKCKELEWKILHYGEEDPATEGCGECALLP